MSLTDILHIKNLHQYYTAVGLGKPSHPLISIYNFRDMPAISVEAGIKFTLGFYVITIKYKCNCKSTYGQTTYDYDEGIMGFFGPNQVIGIDTEILPPGNGWCLTFHPDFLQGYDLGKKIKNYHFFNYSVSEALILSEDEERDMEELFQKIKKETGRPIDNFSQDILVAQLELLLTFSNRYYNRQFITRKPINNQLLTRFETLLNDHFEIGGRNEALPTVSYFAEKLHLSSKYLSDMLKQLTGLTAQQHIHEKIIEIAKQQLSTTNLTVSEIAYRLGFNYSQSFNKFFKVKTTQTPLAFRALFN
ncbi:Helix-turn-helix domain-containing protein [Chitinophaga sp. CF118]|uniref:helix-turn-helix domain-containing protein n=1 Tax=Chitinophaga sp. CF118 TaxID=1884367 RepID=UPI0008E6DF18|nr:helix-turn-helix domain-containing protein [Chitinophaga sp. CF118]SFD60362.1 Helix-turn-helix domain-containing protein [Chitinophaga sp. CF118]